MHTYMLEQENKQEKNTQVHKHLSTVFVVVGIVSFGPSDCDNDHRPGKYWLALI